MSDFGVSTIFFVWSASYQISFEVKHLRKCGLSQEVIIETQKYPDKSKQIVGLINDLKHLMTIFSLCTLFAKKRQLRIITKKARAWKTTTKEQDFEFSSETLPWIQNRRRTDFSSCEKIYFL